MSQSMISIENLSKAYRLGLTEKTHDTLTGAVKWLALAPLREFQKLRRLNTFSQNGSDPDGSKQNATEDDILWALKDVSFEVAEGEVVGIIGRNGAGKSTLLKVLSRITEPTSGHAVIRGRVSSLLEVGTGFHPELSGRENIYMNGTILGMTKREIDRKFDEIVDFSGVEKFLDTPVKRYSSGMQVRLAFAVAAHLEPEILVVDEVLAVGDAEFQKKCMGKMQNVAQGGRTVLFVSHNMAAVRHLCSRCCLIHGGALAFDGGVATSISQHLKSIHQIGDAEIRSRADRKGSGALRIVSLRMIPANRSTGDVQCGEDVLLEVHYGGGRNLGRVDLAFGIIDSLGTKVAWVGTQLRGKPFCNLPPTGKLICRLPRLPLSPGRYSINIQCLEDDTIADWVQDAAVFDVVPGDFFGTGMTRSRGWGVVEFDHEWLYREKTGASKC